MIAASNARVGRPLAPCETLAVALAVTVLGISAGRAGAGFLVGGIAVGWIAAALRRRFGRGPRLVLLVAFAPTAFMLNERGALGIALIIVPWMIDAMFTWRSADEDVLVHALAAATSGLALAAEIVGPWQLAIPVLQIFVSMYGLADVALRRRDARRLHTLTTIARPLVDPRLARATASFTLILLVVGGVVFALVPSRGPSGRNGGSARDREETSAKHPHGWAVTASGSNVSPPSALGQTPTVLDPRRAIRLAGPTAIAYSLRVWRDRVPVTSGLDAVYLKERVFEHFDGARWTTDEGNFVLVHDADDGVEDGAISLASVEKGEAILESLVASHGLSDRFAILWPPVLLEEREALVDRDAAIAAKPESNPVAIEFTAKSKAAFRPPAAAIALARAARDAERCLFLPPTMPAIVEVASRLRAKSRTAGEFCLAVERWVRERAPYVLADRPALPRDADPVADLLLDGKGSHCETFAMAMALLCRLGGVPARIAVGYRGAVWSEEKREFHVPAMWGHAWVEAKLDGIGWVPFDPTPSIDELHAGARKTDVSLSLWFPERLLAFLESLVSNDAEKRRLATAALLDSARENPLWPSGIIVVCSLALTWRVLRRRGTSHRAARLRLEAERERASHVRAYEAVRRFLVRAGYAILPSTTPRELLALAGSLPEETARAAATTIVGDYEAARFGRVAPTLSRDALDAVVAALER